MEYKDTIFLPKSSFEMRANLPIKEPKILEAGGGKKSSEESSTPGIVEAGGGKKITKEVAQAEFEEEKSILEEE